MPGEAWLHARRLLAVCIGSAAELAAASPALLALRLALPDAEHTLLISAEAEGLAPLMPWIDRPLVLQHLACEQRSAGAAPAVVERAVADALRGRRFDAAMIFTPPGGSPYPAAYLLHQAGIPARAGQSTEFGGKLLTERVVPMHAEHSAGVDHHLHLLRSLGFGGVQRRSGLTISPELSQRAAETLSLTGVQADAPFILLPRKSASVAPETPLRRSTAARALARQAGRCVLTVGPAAVLAASPFGEAVELRQAQSPSDYAALVARAEFVVAADPFASSLADALSRPTLAPVCDPVSIGNGAVPGLCFPAQLPALSQ